MTWLLMAWRWIANSRAGQIVGAVLAALAGVWLYGRRKHSQGRTEAEKDMKDADQKNADEIRRRARDADGNGVQPDDRRGVRDRNGDV